MRTAVMARATMMPRIATAGTSALPVLALVLVPVLVVMPQLRHVQVSV